ncbi:T9SS type A sorting domain-containing protein [Flavobacterium sp.]|uniref:T9SS type A sorting domain-containing protein n=1 Tax=Flavobacterium sp. TaxID=239 RepID=UPI00286C7BF0|nr:T9SS type A sorting domain-containing protein [Flavobacterium sp.]
MRKRGAGSELRLLPRPRHGADATGGAPPYQYSINSFGPYQTSNTFTFVANGTYSISVIDMNGCSCSSQVNVTISGLLVSIGATLDMPTSTLFADVLNGTQPYTYHWRLNGIPISGATNSSLDVRGQYGLFSLTVTDSNGLTGNASYNVSGGTLYLNNDSFTIYPSNNTISTSNQSVLSNDFLGSLPIISQQSINSITLTGLSVPTGFLLNANGTVSVLPGTPSGQYLLTYQACEIQYPNFCLIATATITVVNSGILLKAFIDSNANAIQDNGEVNFTQGQFGYILNDNGIVNNVFSSNGEYLINESNPLNSYDLNFTINPAYNSQYSLTTSSYSNVTTSNLGVVTYSFPVTEIPFKDLLVSIYSNGTPPRPGFTYSNQIMYKNNGNQTIASGTIDFTKNNAVTITNISQSGTTSNADGFTFDFVNLLPGEFRYINVTMQVPTIPTVNLGQVLTNSVSVSIPFGDINSSNNQASLSQIIVGSFDPNDKAESHGGKILHSTFTSNDYLTYTIQFENTGTYNAENVRVNDILDAKLDETSIIMIKSSHDYELNRVGNNVNWNFNGIELPPSVANTQIGHGYIVFKIKPKLGYSIGDIIPNTANIFFDFNPAIVTNTFNTEFVSTLAINQFDLNVLSIYPNPVHNSFKIINTSLIDSVSIFSILGQEVITKNVDGLTTEINTTSLANGIYFVKIISDGREKTIKIIKE